MEISMTNNKLLFISEEDDGSVIFLRHELQEETQGMSFKQRLLQWFGRFALLVLGAATLAPATLNISTGFRPWVCVAFILWFFAYCAGMFNP
jgi:hypothetical protein